MQLGVESTRVWRKVREGNGGRGELVRNCGNGLIDYFLRKGIDSFATFPGRNFYLFIYFFDKPSVAEKIKFLSLYNNCRSLLVA